MMNREKNRRFFQFFWQLLMEREDYTEIDGTYRKLRREKNEFLERKLGFLFQRWKLEKNGIFGKRIAGNCTMREVSDLKCRFGPYFVVYRIKFIYLLINYNPQIIKNISLASILNIFKDIPKIYFSKLHVW